MYNQIRYTLFGLSTTNTAIGTDGSVERVDEIYNSLKIGHVYDFGLDERKKAMEDYADDIKYVSDYLDENGVPTIFFLTPSKASWNTKVIPLRYKMQEKKMLLKVQIILFSC